MRLLLILMIFSSTAGLAQTKAIEVYLKGTNADELAGLSPGSRSQRDLQNLLPHIISNNFVEYVKAKSGQEG